MSSTKGRVTLSKEDEAAFKDMVLKACDDTFLTLGGAVRESTYQWLRVNYGISREEIAENFEKFIESIQSIYGLNANVVLIGLATLLSRQFKLKATYNYEQVDLEQLMRIYYECQKSMVRNY